MNCSQFRKFIDSFADGDLSGSMRLEFESHRVMCPSCRREVAVFEAAEQIIAADPLTVSASPEFTDRIMAEIAARAGMSERSPGDTLNYSSASAHRHRRFLALSLLAATGLQAAAAVLFAIGVFWRQPAPSAANLTDMHGSNVATNADVFRSGDEHRGAGDPFDGPPAITRANSAYLEEFDEIDLRERYYSLIVDKLMVARSSVESDIHALARYPYECALVDTSNVEALPSDANPLMLFFDALVPPQQEAEFLGENAYSL
jgi:hypothetical protein